jgi:hydroxymethylbilane synthase
MTAKPLRVATRASRLALWQANHVAALLGSAASARPVELVEVSTYGDRDQTGPLRALGPFGVFTREVQAAVLDGRADMAVHSLKDLPTETVSGLVLAAVPERGPTFDVLVLPRSLEATGAARGLAALSSGARVGSGSPRRRAQLLCHRPDLRIDDVRGNVETRLRKLDDGQYDALILAEAGLRRLDLEERIGVELHPPFLFPAVGQGALGVECRADDADLQELLRSITDPFTLRCVTAERALLAELRAGCQAPLGVWTYGDFAQLTLEAVVLSADGKQRLHAMHAAPATDPAALGRAVAEHLRRQGAEQLVAQVRNTITPERFP